MIIYNADGSGTIVAADGAATAFPAGITQSDLLARNLAFIAVDPPPPINVTVNSPDVTALTTNVASVFTYLPTLVTAVGKIPGAAVIPPAPVAVAAAAAAAAVTP
jgi:hypothetical protein